MIRRLRRAEIAGQSVLLFKPRIDDRYDAHDVVSHAGVRMAAVPVDGSAELVARSRGCDVVGIDEVQFFEPSIVDAALALADGGIRVIAAGLDQDFRRQPFGPMPELLARAEFVDKLQAVCHRCGGPATTTQRLVDGKPGAYSGETIVVGALDSYEARCRDCHEPGADAVSSWPRYARRGPARHDRAGGTFRPDRRARRLVPNAIQIAFRSVNLSRAWIDLSRPKPDCLKPPNGLEMSPASNVFTQTMPARIARAAVWATLTSSVQIPAERP